MVLELPDLTFRNAQEESTCHVTYQRKCLVNSAKPTLLGIFQIRRETSIAFVQSTNPSCSLLSTQRELFEDLPTLLSSLFNTQVYIAKR